MTKFTDTAACTSHIHCRACRNDERWRQSIKEHFEWDGECPEGFPIGEVPVSTNKPVVIADTFLFRQAQLQNMVDGLQKQGFKGQTLSPQINVKDWIRANQKPEAMLFWEECGGVFGDLSAGQKQIAKCYEKEVCPIAVDFGYFDHYAGLLFYRYTFDGNSTIQANWLDLPDDDSWKRDPSIAKYVQSVQERYQEAAQSTPVQKGGYVLAYPQTSARRCSLSIERHSCLSWMENVIKAFPDQKIVFKSSPVGADIPELKSVDDYEILGEAEFVQGRDLERDANLAVHARTRITNNSSITNEMLIAELPIYTTGLSIAYGLDVFDELSSWDDANKPAQLKPEGNRNKFAHWIVQHWDNRQWSRNVFQRIVRDWQRQLEEERQRERTVSPEEWTKRQHAAGTCEQMLNRGGAERCKLKPSCSNLPCRSKFKYKQCPANLF